MRRVCVQLGKTFFVIAAALLVMLALLAGYGLYLDHARSFFHRVCSLFIEDHAMRCLMTMYLASLMFQVLHYLVPLISFAALFLLCRGVWSAPPKERLKLWWLPAAAKILAATFLSFATAAFAVSSLFYGEYGPLPQARALAQACRADVALLRAGAFSTYDGPLYDEQFTSTWALDNTVYSSVPSQRAQPQLFHVSSLGGVALKLPEGLYHGSEWLDRYMVRYLPNTGVAVSIERLDSGNPGPDQWKYGDMVYKNSRGRAVTAAGEELAVLGYGGLSADQQRFLDLLLSDVLVNYYSHSWNDFIYDITWDDNLTGSERDTVFYLYALFQNAAYSGDGYLGFYPYSFSYTPLFPNRISIDTVRSEDTSFLEKMEQFSKTSQDIINSLPKGLDDCGKMKWTTEYIAEHTEYDPGSQYDYGGCAYGCLVQGRCVCAGYADAYAALLYRLSIPCIVATSTNHAWNVVKCGSQLYHIDTTWMDQDGWIDDTYFMQETEERLKDVHPLQRVQDWEEALALLTPPA